MECGKYYYPPILRSMKSGIDYITCVFPDPVGPTSIKPCLTVVVSYNWIIFLMYSVK